jgi:hypothetical protein
VGTLKAAKKRGIIDFPGQMLLKGPHNDVDVVLVRLEGVETGASEIKGDGAEVEEVLGEVEEVLMDVMETFGDESD